MDDLIQFRELGLSDVTLDALRVKGFTAPTAIQALAIPGLLSGSRDLIGQAQTGTGKTAAFALPILETLKCSKKVQALILAPTRELCIQIADEIESLKGANPLRSAPLYGGESIENQFRKLKQGVDIVIGTPGRIMDHMRRGTLKLDALKFAVLDEADEMLDMGFVEDIEAILSETNPDKRMLMFSATMPGEISKIAEKFMQDPEIIRTIPEAVCTDLAEQFYYEVKREDKFAALSRLIDIHPDMAALVFCRTRVDVDELTEKLNTKGYNVEALHGDIAQAQRTRVINRFKAHKFRLLIATDVAARGIDVSNLTHVINYSIPRNAEVYIHRIGRTGRAGNKGAAITFVTPGEVHRLSLIKKEAKADIIKKELPGAKEIIEAKKQRFAEQLSALIDAEKHRDCIGFAEELLTLTDNPAEAFAAALKMMFKNELDPANYPEIGAKPKQKKTDRKAWEADAGDPNHTRLYIGIGKNDNFGAVKMLDLIWELARIKKARVGKIDCFDRFSFIDLEPEDAAVFMKNARSAGINVHPEQGRQEKAPMPAEHRKTESKNNGKTEKRTEKKTGKPASRTRSGSALRNWVADFSEDIPFKEKRSSQKQKNKNR
ncbi:MAG: DEAD/DEAH box helicase [Lentisphaeria bacterium]|nr:DEAD/DEAH box helicase [Lentisphaeria bacterium]